ncbi:MAG: type II secretion system F family protein [Coriobacteriales bacterium]|nr:type II secretion system F family protein [Coriobacteriales bacterium]
MSWLLVAACACLVAVFCATLEFCRFRQRNKHQLRLKAYFGLCADKSRRPKLRLPWLRRGSAKADSGRFLVELPQLLEVLCMGLRAGLGFDAAFALYVEQFRGSLAGLCKEQFRIWSRGLESRERCLNKLARQVNLAEFSRFVNIVTRAMGHGASMTELLLDLAAQSRQSYREMYQTRIAKAPVKMLLPTSGLILPAMLLLVMGPIVLGASSGGGL